MNENINIFLSNFFEPHKNRNHLSVDEQGKLHYSNDEMKPSKLWKVREAAENVLYEAGLAANEHCQRVEDNVVKLNGKIKKHNDRLIVKLFDIVAKIVKIFNENWGNQIKNYYQIKEIEIPEHLKNSRNNTDKQDAKEIEIPEDLKNSRNNTDEQKKGPARKTVNRDKGKEKVDETSSTDTVKINDDYDSESDGEDTETEEILGTTVINGNVNTDSFELQSPASKNDHASSIVKTQLNDQFENGPSWGKEVKGFSIPSDLEPTIIDGNHRFFLVRVERENQGLNFTLIDIKNPENLNGVQLEQHEDGRTSLRAASNSAFRYSATSDGKIKCHGDHRGNLIINNDSGHELKTLSASDDEPKVHKSNRKVIITANDTYLCWLNNKEETGFIVIRK